MVVNIHCGDISMARAAEAKIVWDNLARQITARDVTSDALRSAVIAVYGISWGRAVITTLTANRINDLLALMRNSTFPAQEYARLTAFGVGGYAASSDYPPELMEWLRIAEQLRLELPFGRGAILATALFLQTAGIITPSGLGALSPKEFRPVALESPNPKLLRTFWRVARLAYDAPRRPAIWRPHHLVAKDSLVKAANAHAAHLERTDKLVLSTTDKLRLRPFGQLGPAR